MVSEKKDSDQGEFLSSDEKSKVGYYTGPGCVNTRVEYFVINGHAIAEGDICLGTEDELKASTDPKMIEAKAAEAKELYDIDVNSPQEAGFIKDQKYRWPDCTIPYSIDSALPNQNRITDAMTHWTDRTGIKFVKRSNQPDYLYFTDLGGCWSYIGRQGGKQNVSIGSGCSTGNAIHEIGHAIGLYHEQSRNDRDTFVTINWQNIISGKESNFSQYLNNGIDIGPYDYCSIMHYPRTAFSKNGLDTITPLLAGAQCMGQRTALSDRDIAATKQMYPGCFKTPIQDITTKPAIDLTVAVTDRLTPTIARLDIKPTVARLDVKPTIATVDFKTTARKDIISKSPITDTRPTITTIDIGTAPAVDIRKTPNLDKNPLSDRVTPKNIGDRVIPNPRVITSRFIRDPYVGYDPYAAYDPYAEYDPYEEYDPYAEYDPYSEYDPYAENDPYTEYDPYAPFVLSIPHMAPDWEAVDEAISAYTGISTPPTLDYPKNPRLDTLPRRDVPKLPIFDTYPARDLPKIPWRDKNPIVDRF